MANELPYFRFTVQAWQNGDISLETYEMKGFFIDVCGYYWIKDCSITLALLQKKFRGMEEYIKTLIDLDIIKHEKRHDKIQIVFLDKQYDMLSEKRKRRQQAGSKGGNAKAKAKQTPSYKDKDKDKDKNKDKDKDKNPPKLVSVHSEIKKVFLEFYSNKKNEDYYWTAKDAAKVKPLLKKLEFKIKKKHGDSSNLLDKDYVDAFKYFLSKISDQWILDNLSMSIIDSKFNEIITSNGKQTSQTRPSGNELIEAVLRQNGINDSNGGDI